MDLSDDGDEYRSSITRNSLNNLIDYRLLKEDPVGLQE